jgi:hypothetical protein
VTEFSAGLDSSRTRPARPASHNEPLIGPDEQSTGSALFRLLNKSLTSVAALPAGAARPPAKPEVAASKKIRILCHTQPARPL